MEDAEFLKYYKRLRKEDSDYIILPNRVTKKFGLNDSSDEFGSRARYQAISMFLESYKPLKKLVDLGGHCGFFSLSLLDDRLIDEAVVYDDNKDFLAFGKTVAEKMRLPANCHFIPKKITLESIDLLPSADVVICLNLMHHAGSLFDEKIVSDLGWEKYAELFLIKLRKKYKIGAIGLGFAERPLYWDVEKNNRRRFFYDILIKAGWNVISNANVYDLIKSGGNATKEPPPILKPSLSQSFKKRAKSYVGKLLRPKVKKIIRDNMFPTLKKAPTAANYHLYLMD